MVMVDVDGSEECDRVKTKGPKRRVGEEEVGGMGKRETDSAGQWHKHSKGYEVVGKTYWYTRDFK